MEQTTTPKVEQWREAWCPNTDTNSWSEKS